jgi:SAM-dependent methyltransferase
MRNKDNWTPSKFVYKGGRLISSRDSREVGVGSRLITDIVASFYDVYIPKFAKGKLIDLGCGKVPLFEAYKDYITDNVCIDWESSLHKNEYLDYECDLNKNLPFSGSEFDTIILSDVLEHIPQPEKLWTEMSRILTLNGKAIINVPFYYWVHEAPHDYYRYSEYALRRFANLSGLKILLLKPIGGTPEILADILAKNLQFVPIIGTIIALAIQYITAAFIRTALGKKLSEKTSQSFPLGYFLVAEKSSKEI